MISRREPDPRKTGGSKIWLLLVACACARRYSTEEYARLGVILSAAAASPAREREAAAGVASTARRAAASARAAVANDGVSAPLFTAARNDTEVAAMVEAWAAPVEASLLGSARSRLAELLADTRTDECRTAVTEAFTDVYTRLLREDWLPFEQAPTRSDCDPSQKTADAPRKAPVSADAMRLCYFLLVHESPQQVMRLVGALEEGDRHTFVVHVDAKASSDDTFAALQRFAASKPHVHVMVNGRTSVSWGGFNVVQATLNGLGYILDAGIPFDWIATMSGYTSLSARVLFFSSTRRRATRNTGTPSRRTARSARGSRNTPATPSSSRCGRRRTTRCRARGTTSSSATTGCGGSGASPCPSGSRCTWARSGCS